jgi:hypothetical protein
MYGCRTVPARVKGLELTHANTIMFSFALAAGQNAVSAQFIFGTGAAVVEITALYRESQPCFRIAQRAAVSLERCPTPRA